MLTVVTTPSIGAVRRRELDLGEQVVPRLARRCETWVWALLTLDLRLADRAVASSSAASRFVLGDRSAGSGPTATTLWRPRAGGLRSVVSAVARTAPFLTVSPTLTLTSVTVQVAVPARCAVAPARWAGEPKATP